MSTLCSSTPKPLTQSEKIPESVLENVQEKAKNPENGSKELEPSLQDPEEGKLWRTQGKVNGLNAQRVNDNQLIAQLNQQLQNQQNTTQELFAARHEIQIHRIKL
ncbi:unnamed protein product [Caenorhabditis nigoni]